MACGFWGVKNQICESCCLSGVTEFGWRRASLQVCCLLL